MPVTLSSVFEENETMKNCKAMYQSVHRNKLQCSPLLVPAGESCVILCSPWFSKLYDYGIFIIKKLQMIILISLKWLCGKEKLKRNLWYSSWGLPLCVILLAPFVKVRLIKATGEGISGFSLRGLTSYKEHSVANSDTNISAGLNWWNLSECVICTKWKRSCSVARLQPGKGQTDLYSGSSCPI